MGSSPIARAEKEIWINLKYLLSKLTFKCKNMAGFAQTISNLLAEIKKKNNAYYFVETGTFHGDTTKKAATIFEHVFTIDIDMGLSLKAKLANSFKNCDFLCGNSPEILEELIPRLDKNTVFFLDAHWAGDLSSRASTDTPLKEELLIILKRNNLYQDIIVIDDIGWIGKRGEIGFKPEWNSKYFPNGGVFAYDWSHITKDDILNMFKGKKYEEKDDRMIIYT